MKIKSIVIAAGLIAISGSAAFGVWKWADTRPVDKQAMRSYLLSKLSDAEIRKLHEEAQRDFVASSQREDAKFSKGLANARERRATIRAMCSDIVHRERNPRECRIVKSSPLVSSEPIQKYRSVAHAYERKLMGICEIMNTVGDARRAGCLP